MNESQNKWKNVIPWFLTISCCIVIFFIGYFLLKNLEWFKEGVFDTKIQRVNTPEYRIYAYHLHLSMVKRSIGLFSGFIILFLGLGVLFYSLNDKSILNLESHGLKAKIGTASPGLIVLLIGAFLIMFTIGSKDTSPYFYQEIPIRYDSIHYNKEDFKHNLNYSIIKRETQKNKKNERINSLEKDNLERNKKPPSNPEFIPQTNKTNIFFKDS